MEPQGERKQITTDADKRYWIRQWLDAEYGHKCALLDESCKGELIIDHKDSNRSNWKKENLRWLCLSHNKRQVTVVQEREREKTMKDVIDYQSGSAEMQVNDLAEIPYRNWLEGRLSLAEATGKPLFKKQAIDAGAEKCNVSPTTTRKYLAKAVSELGP